MTLLRLSAGIGVWLAVFVASLAAQEATSTPMADLPAPASPSQPAEPTSPFALYPPGMFGDLLAILPVRPPSGGAAPPVAFLSSFKISENESPRPLDRVFLVGNYYDNVDRALLAPGATANVFREMIGFEKTFLQGDASIGVRLPYFQLTGAPGLGETRIGDLSVLLKYAFVNNRATGNLFSGGLVVTAPTGPSLPLPGQSAVNPTIFQPWIGGIWNWKDLFVQNFTAVAIPTDARDVALFFKSIGVGYWLYRTDDPERFLRALAPQAELHLSTPLNHRGLDSRPIGFPDTLDFTGGCYFFLRRAVLGLGVGAPLTGPKPYDFQVTANLNYCF
jgi:hypothetical protein